MRASPSAMRVGLVLGAGGVVGAAWLIGALEALASETGWEPSDADVIVGTSAGSVVGSLIADGHRAGVPRRLQLGPGAGRRRGRRRPRRGAGRAAGRPRAPRRARRAHERRGVQAAPRGAAGRARLWRLAFNALRHPRRHAPSALMAGWLPRHSCRPDRSAISSGPSSPATLADHPAFWAVARRSAPAAASRSAATTRRARAVGARSPRPARSRASTTHPAIDGRRYVDGGVCSPLESRPRRRARPGPRRLPEPDVIAVPRSDGGHAGRAGRRR